MSNQSSRYRDYVYLGLTQSLCPTCRSVVPAKIISRAGRVYFQKECETHGVREDLVCSDVRWFDRFENAQPAKLPAHTATSVNKGCPYDCGLCDAHEQHTCIGVLEITDACNLSCPMCYASSLPGQRHKSYEQVCAAIDALVRSEGRPDVLQISGGEPTVHPELFKIIDYALSQPIEYIMLNTNGIRLASDDVLLEKLSQHRDRFEVYLQFDGVDDDVYVALRGEPLYERKLKAVERLESMGLNVTLVATLQAGVNGDQLGKLVAFAAEHPCVTGISLQPATYSGRHFLPDELESRITFPDVIRGLCEQTENLFTEDDFFPLPCAHPNCHILSLIYRHGSQLVPLTRMFDINQSIDLLANGLALTRRDGVRMLKEYLSRVNCCGTSGCCGPEDSTPVASGGIPVLNDANVTHSSSKNLFSQFAADVLAEQLGARDLLRITITSFLDVYNFDLRRVVKCCTHHTLPTGHIIPFCAYNVLYRDGHVSLPELDKLHSSVGAAIPS